MTNVYCDIISELAPLCPWIQIDEPILCTDIPDEARQAFTFAYSKFKAVANSSRLLLTTYFGDLGDNLELAMSLPVDGIHVDLVRGPNQLEDVLSKLPSHFALSLGLVDGRNIWKTDLEAAATKLNIVRQRVKENKIMVGSSCSLLHSPVDINAEEPLDPALKQWMAFAVQKCEEIAALNRLHPERAHRRFRRNKAALLARAAHADVADTRTRERLQAVTPDMFKRTSAFAKRSAIQRERLNLPLFPTTTIGSYPQTTEIRKTRLAFRKGELSEARYTEEMQASISTVVDRQEELGLDVLVHGEPERNDMVEYFGQQLKGFCFTSNGWVQSYGSRCVKPPIIYGDVSRPEKMTVDWAVYAQSLTDRHMKGMLTGPVTFCVGALSATTFPEVKSAARSRSPSAMKSLTSKQPESASSRSTKPPTGRHAYKESRSG